jgi:hypothetical protein
MPNIIRNTIILENNINAASFKDEALEGFNLEGSPDLPFDNDIYFDFNIFIPQTKEIKDIEKWNLKNWNTKWNSGRTVIEELNNNKLIFHFDTAWDIPTPIIKAYFKKYKAYEITYNAHEEMNAFSYKITQEENKKILKVEYSTFYLL